MITERHRKIKPKYYVGIDGGVNNGFALWNTKSKCFDKLDTFTFWELIEVIDQIADTDKDTIFIVEDIAANKNTFNRGLDNKLQQKVSQNVGGAKAYTHLIMEYLEINNFDIIKKRPSKGSFTKLKKKQFFNITGDNSTCSQHARDAAMLCYGM